MPSWLTLKLGGMILGGLAVLVFVALAFHWKTQAADRKEQLATICAATRAAAGQPKLKCRQVPAQIGFFKDTIEALHAGIEKQNAAVKALGDESAKARQEAEKAVSASRERVKAAETASDRLAASARDSAREKRPCEPSDAVKRSWR